MIIEFKRLTMKNFMSIGNVPMTLDLNRNNLTLISGKNGSAKSGVTSDALAFVLYNKSYRGANKPQLINSINNRDCLVEIEFSARGNDYKVIRGMKPNVFEIYEGNSLLQQEGANKDYQQILEQQILGMTFKTFKQISILSTSNYVPFMRLTALDRRQIVDELLDIQIFSQMHELLKDKQKQIKSDLSKIDQILYKIKVNTDSLKSSIDNIKESDDNAVDVLKENISNNLLEIRDLKKEISEGLNFIKNNNVDNQLSKVTDDWKQLSDEISKLVLEIKKIDGTLKFLDTAAFCPSCNQTISEEHKQHCSFSLSLTKDEKSDTLTSLSDKQKTLDESKQKLLATVKKNEEVRSNIRQLQLKIDSCNSVVGKLQSQISEIEKKRSVNVDSLKQKLSDLDKSKVKADDKQTKISLKNHCADICQELLKDSGIKAQIIKKFVPAMNTIINQFLDKLEFSVSFTFDENFNEIIRSRYRDEFTYDSFSAGERSRIDLALLFMFREISRLKNSVSTNVLVIDEILESLDDIGIENVFRMFNDMTNVNIFVITHKSELQSRFRHRIELTKIDGFTVIENDL